MDIGLFISEGRGEIKAAVDVGALSKHFRKVASVKVLKDLHSSDSLKAIRREVEEKGLRAVVLAGESPFFYKKTRNGGQVIGMLHSMGINPNMTVVANLKEQVALPHRKSPAEATKKAKALVDVALEKLRLSKEVGMIEVSPKKTVAVIGTAPAGFFAAQRLLERGFRIVFIDKKPPGETKTFKVDIVPTLAYVKSHPDVSFHVSSINDLYGYAGNFRIGLESGESLRAGGIIVAIDDDLKYAEELYPFLRIERDEEGNFKTMFSDTTVAETVNQGMFYIPRGATLMATIAFADSAAMGLDSLLSVHSIRHELFVSEVDQNVCGGCGTCIKTCIFHAAELDPIKKLSSTNIKRCVGCGNCVSACPTGARDQVSGSTAYLVSAIKILAGYEPPKGPKLLCILCEGCGYPSLDYAAKMGMEYPTNIMPLLVKCAGRIDTQFILEAYKVGFGGVAICKCKDDHCLNIVGNVDLDRRANLFRAVLKSRGILPERLRIFGVTECGGGSCVESTMEFLSFLKNLGRP